MVIATMNMIVCLFDKVVTVTLSRKRRRQGRQVLKVIEPGICNYMS